MTYVLYHNPRCSTSRTVLARLQEHGIRPTVVEYLKTPPDIATLRALRNALGRPARTLLREKEPLAAQLGLLEASLDEETLLQAIAAHPILLNRPVVAGPHGARVCRSAETVDELLPP